jgi:leader peptidase (prepilin peptidase) / N-methyltransferase
VPASDLPAAASLGVGAVAALVAGPWLARVSVRLAHRDATATAGPLRVVVTAGLLAAALAGVLLLSGLRPATVALAWGAAAGIVLGAVDLAVHRLPDRVTVPAYAGVATALVVDAAVLDSWEALLRAGLAAGAALALAAGAALLSPEGLGFGDVKLLGLLGLVLGWVGWGALLTGVFLGLLAGAVVSLAMVATRRAGWRTALPFGPPLLVGAALALALAGPVPLP